MSEKTLKTVLGLVAGLIVVYAVAALASRGPETGAALDDTALAGTLDALSDVELESVRISGPDGTIRLERRADGWTANGYRADSSAVAELEAALGDARIAHLAAANPANHPQLGVVKDSARVLELTPREGEAVRLLVGESGPTSPSAYVRLPAADEVYLVRGDLYGTTRRALDDWRDRTIVRVDTALIARITVGRDGDRYTIERDSAGWHFADGAAAVDQPAVHDLLAELADLEAAGFAESGAGSAEPARTLAAFSRNSEPLAELSLTESGDDGSDFLITTASRATVFELAGWRADRLTPARDEVTATE